MGSSAGGGRRVAGCAGKRRRAGWDDVALLAGVFIDWYIRFDGHACSRNGRLNVLLINPLGGPVPPRSSKAQIVGFLDVGFLDVDFDSMALVTKHEWGPNLRCDSPERTPAL